MKPILLRSMTKRHVLFSNSVRNNHVKIVEVGPRDGLQNEKTIVPQEIKLKFIEKLVQANVNNIEATAFVSPKWVPQMADQSEIMSACHQNLRKEGKNIIFSALTPNLQGYKNAVKTGTDEVAVFAAASQAFSKKNINCSIEESIERFAPIFQQAKKDQKKVRGYVSCIAGCPYQGNVPIDDVVNVTKLLYEAGCYEISLGDTIGVGTSERIKEVVSAITNSGGIPINAIALHCHDTYGQAMSNCLAALEMGVRVFDGATSGLGGCPYAKGASGNVATEDLVYMLHGNGFETEIDLSRLVEAGNFISEYLGRANGSKVAVACRK